jgi:hypothetical protein
VNAKWTENDFPDNPQLSRKE